MYKCGGERGSVVGSLYYLRCDRKEVLMRFGGECEDSGWEGGVCLEQSGSWVIHMIEGWKRQRFSLL